MDDVAPEAFLTSYPDGIRASADALRRLVRRAVPDTVERVRPGWRLIGYEVPVGRRLRYFAYVAPEVEHVHLGFEYGVWMADPSRLLQGADLKLRKVRYLTFRPGDPIPENAVLELTREGARVAAMSQRERVAVALDSSWQPSQGETDAGDPS
jgi:hypothetical protein